MSSTITTELPTVFDEYIRRMGLKTLRNFNISFIDASWQSLIIDIYIPRLATAIIFDSEQSNTYYGPLRDIFGNIILIREPGMLNGTKVEGIRELTLSRDSRYDIENCLILVLTNLYAKMPTEDFSKFNNLISEISSKGICEDPSSVINKILHIIKDNISQNIGVPFAIRSGILLLPSTLWNEHIASVSGLDLKYVITRLNEMGCVIDINVPRHIGSGMYRCYALDIKNINKKFEINFSEG